MISAKHPDQKSVFLDPSRFRVAVCGRQWGKSVLGAETALDVAFKRKQAKIFIVGPTRELVKDIFWEYLKRRIADLKWRVKINESELSIKRLTNGAEIQLKSADKPDRLRGRKLAHIVMDEYADMDARVWPEVLRPTLTHTQGTALFIGTPKGRNHFYELYEEAGKPEFAHEWGRWSYKTADSPFVLPGEIASAKARLDERTFKQEYLADFVDYLGRAYVYHDATVHRVSKPFNPIIPVSVALDFNISPCLWEMAQVDGDRAHFFDEIKQSETDIWRMCAELKRRLDGRGIKAGGRIEFYGDYTSASRRDVSATASSWDIVRNEFSGYNAEFRLRKNPNIVDRINSVNSRLRSADGTVRLTYDPKCVELGKDFELVDMEMLTTKKGQAGDRTHASDAVGYLVHFLWPIVGRLSHIKR